MTGPVPSPVVAGELAAIGTTNRVLANRADVLPEAVRLARTHLETLDAALSRFRSDSEVSRLAALPAREDGTVQARVSALVVDHVLAAQEAARLTGGLVDLTVGAALAAHGYDADLADVRGRTTPAAPRSPVPVPGWRSVVPDRRTGVLTMPAGTVLDVGASGKAHAADTLAELLARRLPGGFLVDLGGDLATSGVGPAGGWPVAITGPGGEERQVVLLDGQAMTTSSTQARTWETAGGRVHHIVDPRTGAPASTRWGQVSVVAATALQAGAASTAAIVLGADAPAWLTRAGLPARLDGRDGDVVTTPGWPLPQSRSTTEAETFVGTPAVAS